MLLLFVGFVMFSYKSFKAMRFVSVVYLVFSLLTSGFCVFAGYQLKSDTLYLTIDSAISLALNKSENINMLNLDIEKMDALLDEMKASRWFKLSASAGLSISKSDSNYPYAMHRNMYVGRVAANITQPIYTFGAISNSINAAKEAKNIAELSKELGIRSLTFAVAQSYYAALLADENYLIAKNAYDNAVKTKKVVERSAAIRPIKSDLIRASADMASREVLVDIARYNRDKSYRLLKILCFIGDNENIVLSTGFTKQFTKILSDNLTADISNYPELKILKKQSDMYGLQAKAKRAQFYPKLFVTGSVSRDRYDLNKDKTFDRYSNDASIALGINATLWDGGSAFAQARQDRIESMKVLEKYNFQLRNLTNEVNDKIDEYNTYIAALTRLKNTIALAEKSYDMSVSRFKTGKTSALEINDALSGLTSARQQYYNALFVLNTLIYDLEKITGYDLKSVNGH